MTTILRMAIIFLLVGCAHKREPKAEPNASKRDFLYKDMTGEFNVQIEKKSGSKKLITKNQLYIGLDVDTPLEKTITVSKRGVLKFKSHNLPSLRPEVAQHTIWFEKQKFFSQLKVDPKKRKLVVTMVSPEKEWNGVKEYNFPKGNIFCFFTQLPDCLKIHGLLKIGKKKVPIVVIWDSFPYHVEQFRDVSEGPFQTAQVYIERVGKGGTQVGVGFGNQIILYDFNSDELFNKMFWIAQGITMGSVE